MDFLDNDDKQVINDALERAKVLKPNIARAKTAGIDVADAESKLDESVSKLNAIKASFFPE
tara:strand:- start:1210 stop:1392 length:183 start_codon:yes stop_codon:yes gene_type:complete